MTMKVQIVIRRSKLVLEIGSLRLLPGNPANKSLLFVISFILRFFVFALQAFRYFRRLFNQLATQSKGVFLYNWRTKYYDGYNNNCLIGFYRC